MKINSRKVPKDAAGDQNQALSHNIGMQAHSIFLRQTQTDSGSQSVTWMGKRKEMRPLLRAW